MLVLRCRWLASYFGASVVEASALYNGAICAQVHEDCGSVATV
jgi:hypothetical protein